MTGRTVRSRPVQGFTLLELVVVVTIIGAVAFLTVPRMRLPGKGDDIEAAARWLVAHHHKLRIAAVRCQRRWLLHCDLDAQRLWVACEGVDDDGRAAAIAAGFRFGPDVRLELLRMADGREIRHGQTALVYFPDGHSYLAQALLRTDGQREMAVRLEPFLPEARLFKQDRPFETSAS